MNYIIKSRAHRYIAGRNEEDLFPERYLKTTAWNKLGRFLLPSKHEIGEFAAKTYVRMKDGSYYFQDEFGRQPKTPEEYAQKVEEVKELEETFRIALEKDRAKKKDSGE
ncbi:MAG TPA: hypothetical protein VGL70_24275 [Candidatus Binatia bacterium]